MIVVILLLRILTPQDLALWYLFGAIFGIAALVEGGFGRAITRHVAGLLPKGHDHCSRTYSAAAFLESIAPMYAIATSTVCAVAFISGIYLLNNQGYALTGPYLAAWIAYSIAGGITLSVAFSASALAGLQRLSVASRNEVGGALLNVVLVVVLMLVLDGVLLASLALLLSSILVLLLHTTVLRGVLHSLKEQAGATSFSIAPIALLRDVAPDAVRMLLMLVAYQCLTSGLLLIIAAYQPVAVVASFGATTQIIYMAIAVANSWAVAGFPMLSASNGSALELRTVFWPRFVRAMIVATVGVSLVAVMGSTLVSAVGSRTNLLAGTITAMLCTAVLLEFMVGQFTSLLLRQGARQLAGLNAVAGAATVIAAAYLLHRGFSLEEVIGARILLLLVLVAPYTLHRGLRLLSRGGA